MTNEEKTKIAIEYLTELRDSRQKVLPNEAPYYEAEKDMDIFNIAIKALEENDRLKSDIDGLNNQMDDLCENLVWYINERNRLLANKRLQDNQISSITELCNGYCKNCPVADNSNDCTDCICTHIRGIIGEEAENELLSLYRRSL